MSVINKAAEHFKMIVSQDMKSVEVPEWETTLFFKAAVSFAAEQKVIALHTEGKQVDALCESLVNRACDAEGKRVFTNADKVTLMNSVDPAVILRIVNQMNALSSEVDETDLGN
jgi:hypothetical protein|tara:strand:+ start:347 stop:688 length:342 start_codon:yes stop_codon:yes gene_type:complete